MSNEVIMSKIEKNELGQLEVLAEHFQRAIESKPVEEAVIAAQGVFWNMAAIADNFSGRHPENWRDAVDAIKSNFSKCASLAESNNQPEIARIIKRFCKSFKLD